MAQLSPTTKMQSSDRVLVLKVMDDKKPLSSTGMIDSRLFKGGNNLHAVWDTSSSLWYMKYDEGTVPEPLRQHFTSFSKLFQFAKDYFANRNIEIVQVIS